MNLFLLGIGMGTVGGLIPSPLHLIALTQVALNRWGNAIFVMLAPPLVIDGALLVLTAAFYQIIPLSIAHYVGYVGGAALIFFAVSSLIEMRGKTQEEMAESAKLSGGAVTTAALAELAAPGTWVFWLTIAGPILAKGKETGYLSTVPFFAANLIGYYGASIISVWLINWGTKFHKAVRSRLYLIANILLLVFGTAYIAHSYFDK